MSDTKRLSDEHVARRVKEIVSLAACHEDDCDCSLCIVKTLARRTLGASPAPSAPAPHPEER